MCERTTANQITEDQHYVPRSYMRNFGIIKGKGKKEKVLVSFYQFKGDFFRENIPTKSICYKAYFYGKDGTIEKDFARREGEWASSIRNIIESDSYSLDERQERAIKEFAVYQYNRTLATFNYYKGAMGELLFTHLSNSYSSVDVETTRELVKNKIDNQIEGADLIQSCDESVMILNDLKISIIKFITTQKLITSDMPVIITNPFCPDKAGVANVGIYIMFPVSQDKIIAIYDGKIYLKCNAYMVNNNEEDVINFNKYQVLSAEERIIATNKKHLEEVILDTDLLMNREIFQAKRKVDSNYDGAGTFFAMHSRSIPYEFQLSFCALPKTLRKIPSDCREALSRKYSYEAWINLLVRVYRLPDLLKTSHDLPPVKVNEMRDGYSKMQRFMDDYWEIPIKDRTITPELMRTLRTVPMNYFPV